MKPFNLERALAGDPVVTRDGELFVEELHLFKKILAVVINGHLYSYNLDGTLFCNIKDHRADLMMAPTKRKGWINIYIEYIHKKHNMPRLGGCIYESIDEAKKAANPSDDSIQIEIEWEE